MRLASEGFNAGEVIIEHVANSPLDHPIIHLPTLAGIDFSVTKHVFMLWVVAAVVFVVVSVLAPNGQRQALVSLATARWQSPTDFLLRVPGAEYLETMPSFTTDWRNP